MKAYVGDKVLIIRWIQVLHIVPLPNYSLGKQSWHPTKQEVRLASTCFPSVS